jgi:hypothetical protein
MQERFLKPDEVSLPIVAMPGEWATHCCGCLAPAPETTTNEDTGKTSAAGCRCLMCPGWYACLACAGKEAAAHRDAHPQGLHFTYCVTAEDEGDAVHDEAATLISARKFVFESLLAPFSKMFLPTIAVFVQACV